MVSFRQRFTVVTVRYHDLKGKNVKKVNYIFMAVV